MANRFPFDSSGHSGTNPLNNPQVRAALGLSNIDEALYLQRQQEAQRDFQLRQMLLQEQLDQQSRLESILAQEQQLKALGEHLQEIPADLQQQYSRLLLNEQMQREERDRLRIQAEEELRRRQLLAHQQLQQQQHHNAQLSPQLQPAVPVIQKLQSANQSILRGIAADSLAGNAIKRSDLQKKEPAQAEDGREEASTSVTKKRVRANSKESIDVEAEKDQGKKENHEDEKAKSSETVNEKKAESVLEKLNEANKPSVQDLLDFASSTGLPARNDESRLSQSLVSVPRSQRGSFGDLIEAARKETQNDNAAGILTSIKQDIREWSDSENEDAEEEEERQIAVAKGDTIILPSFKSYLPQLPEEPMLALPETKKKKRKRHRGILDEDDSSVETKSNGKKKDGKASKAAKDEEKKAFEQTFGYLRHPIDPWWPTTTSIRRERKALRQSNQGDDSDNQELGGDYKFYGNVDRIKRRLKNDIEPGVLEKIPHCRVHRMAIKKRKNMSAPELVYCTQVTELYPNDMMVCCSRCGTWRHTCCGGHYRQYSVREAIEKPFEVVCDRCHVEEKVMEDNPVAKKRIDRQRCEQLRRGLATSAAMRQHSFSKHGGTYKWPLGSVSATHIGGHTRSVHSRHDKAEKQWTDMAAKLGRGYGHRPKEKVKVRTKEFERLLISIEDAEGHTDRHNMLVFLMQDTKKETPVGFEKTRRNIFDPQDDDDSEEKEGADPEESKNGNKNGKAIGPICIKKGCCKSARFDSIFCSDACGVSTLESDLLRTFFYSSDIHPSSLRH